MKTLTLLSIILLSINSIAQKNNTIKIKAANIDRKMLREGTHRYLVYFKMRKDGERTQTQFWTRTIKRIDYNGKSAIEISQEWENKDSVMHIVKSICDAKTMQPLFHKTWWKVLASRTATTKTINTTTVDFINKTVTHNGNTLSGSDTSNPAKKIRDG